MAGNVFKDRRPPIAARGEVVERPRKFKSERASHEETSSFFGLSSKGLTHFTKENPASW